LAGSGSRSPSRAVTDDAAAGQPGAPLRFLGFDVTTADNGADALQLARDGGLRVTPPCPPRRCSPSASHADRPPPARGLSIFTPLRKINELPPVAAAWHGCTNGRVIARLPVHSCGASARAHAHRGSVLRAAATLRTGSVTARR
jgi:hypothetical protein